MNALRFGAGLSELQISSFRARVSPCLNRGVRFECAAAEAHSTVHTAATRRPLFLAVLVLAFLPPGESLAGQVTFAFDATVSQINATPGFAETFPFVPSVGQMMTGTVTFTPIPFGEISDNDAEMKVAWEGETFTGTSYRLLTLNNYNVRPDFPIDSLSVSCGVPQICTEASFVINVREFTLLFQSFTKDVVPGGQIIDSVEEWNLFDDRQVLLFLSNIDDTKRVSVFATVGAVHAVPEPATVMLLSFTVLPAGILCSARLLSHRPCPTHDNSCTI